MALQRFDSGAMSSLHGLWERADYSSLGDVAHRIKGTFSYICANEAKRAAARLEQGARALAEAPVSEVRRPTLTATLTP